MTEQEAIELLKRRKVLSWQGGFGNYDEAEQMAIKALEKQIAKKLKHDVCPNCDTNNDMIIKHLGNPQAHKVVYCWNCGTAIELRCEDDI